MKDNENFDSDIALPDTSGTKMKRHEISLEQITKLSEERLALFADPLKDEEKRLKSKTLEIFVL